MSRSDPEPNFLFCSATRLIENIVPVSSRLNWKWFVRIAYVKEAVTVKIRAGDNSQYIDNAVVY